MKLLALHKRITLCLGIVLLAGVASRSGVAAKEGLEFGAAGWMQFGVVGNSSDTLPRGGDATDYNGKSILSSGAQFTLRNQVSDRLAIGAGFGIVAGNSLIGNLNTVGGGYAPATVGAYVSEANFTYSFNKSESSELFLRGGMFSYIYNPDVKNLGLYLLRGPVYPGFVLSGFETKHVLPVASITGFQLHHRMGAFSHDLLFSSETEFWPYFDVSPAYVAKYQVHRALEVGAGVNFYHLISIDSKVTTDESQVYVKSDTAGNPVDTTQFSFRGVKLMARAAFDPKQVFGAGVFGREDLKLYGEVALLGLDNTEAHRAVYGDYLHRMPVMVGFNIPVLGWLEHLSLEVEWYGAPFHDNLENYKTGYDRPSLFPDGWLNPPNGTVSRNANDDKNMTRDNWKWSLHGAKMIQNHVRVSFQIANDHWRPGVYRGDGDEAPPRRQAIMISPEDWYFTTKLAYFF